MPVWRREHEGSRVFVHYISMLIVVIASLALLGQLARRPAMYSWTASGTMALPTAICLLFTGISLFLISRGERGGE